MAEELLMPKLGMTMEEGILTEWFKQEGDEVEQGDPIFEVMTDKINIEVEAPKAGVLLKKLADEGETVPVNQVVGYIGKAGENVPDSVPSPPSAHSRPRATEEHEAVEPQTTAPDQTGQTEGDGKELTKKNGLVRATPSARRLARIHHIDLQTILGTGPRGRIQARDVEEAAQRKRQGRVGDTAPGDSETPVVRGDKVPLPETSDDRGGSAHYEEVPLKGVRKVIADRMVQSVRQAPHVTLHRWVAMDAALQFKQEWEEAVRDESGYKWSVNDLLVLAAARALRRHPEMNACVEDDAVRRYRDVNIGVAVQTDDGLMVPVLRRADQLRIGELVRQFREIVTKARRRSLTGEEMSGGTFTISNLGGYGIEMFTPIINQPQVAILGVGKIVTQPEWKDRQWVPVQQMPLSLSFDHRVVDGAPAAQFLQTVAHYLEEPRALFI
jgi:pyruvate dehydrogenase E2 component (dihydrolipoamide acetyltransferase)